MPVQVVLRTKTELYEILYGPDNGDALRAVRPSVSKSAVGHLPHTRARTRSRSDRVAVIDGSERMPLPPISHYKVFVRLGR